MYHIPSLSQGLPNAQNDAIRRLDFDVVGEDVGVFQECGSEMKRDF